MRALVKKPKATILTFAGPPGVGKTSLAKSIARAMNRKFVRLSLGGVRDEAEIRGHRRTYIGAFPGQIIQMMKKAGTMNPVFLLDEVDKMSMDFRGDPSAALLEVLDPEQNHTFLDHYLDVEYDLSHVMFICTANVLHTIPQALRDRMEVLQLAGYTEQEKVGDREAVPRAEGRSRARASTKDNLTFTDDAFQTIIQRYTREAGVRNLEREISSICRKVARKVVVEGKTFKEDDHRRQGDRIPRRAALPAVDGRGEERDRHRDGPGVDRSRRRDARDRSDADAGPRQADAHRQARRRHAGVGAGGDELGAIEVRGARHPARLQPPHRRARAHSRRARSRRTGRRRASRWRRRWCRRSRRVPTRRDVAMTGEITLRGKVLPIGGVKEKVLAAHRAGVTTIILPKDNEKDLADIPKNVLDVMNVHLVETMDEVLKLALAGPLPTALPPHAARRRPGHRDEALEHSG